MTEQALTLVTAKTDAARAKELHVKIEAALEGVCRIMDEGLEDGFSFNFSLMPDYRRRHVIALLKISKDFL